MSICDKCKKWNTCRLVDGVEQMCKDYEKMTNRDMLEKKIHEMSDEAIALIFTGLEKGLINMVGGNINSDFAKWLSQSYEEEKKYVVYKYISLVIGTVTKFYSEKELVRCKEDATKFTLQQANEKRNELNNENPKENWMIEEV